MMDKLENIEQRFDEVNLRLSDPNIVDDQDNYRKLMKEYKLLTPIIEKYRQYKNALSSYNEAREMLSNTLDSDFRALAEEECALAKTLSEDLTQELKLLLLPHDENDDKSVIVEIRAGAGGDEAALFAGALFRMYSMYAERSGFKTEILNANPTELGGYKEISFGISGEGAYSRLKFESGVHRVQRVPETEASGRIHTSTVTVAVLAEVEDVEVEINPVDLSIDRFRAGGAGGQHVNKTESAVRITHIPSGIVVECQDERSQHKNMERAMKLLRAKLFEEKQRQQNAEIAKERKSQVGTGDRSERIRTYNYPQSRVTDHRIGLTIHKLEMFLDGDLDEMLNAIITTDQSRKLIEGGE